MVDYAGHVPPTTYWVLVTDRGQEIPGFTFKHEHRAQEKADELSRDYQIAISVKEKKFSWAKD